MRGKTSCQKIVPGQFLGIYRPNCSCWGSSSLIRAAGPTLRTQQINTVNNTKQLESFIYCINSFYVNTQMWQM